MKDIEKILVEILLCITAAIFVLLLFNSCRTKKQAVKVNTQAIIEQTTKTDTHTTDNSKIDEDYTEIVYVLDSAQVIDVLGNSEQPLLKVSQIKVKTSHVKHENNIDSKIYTKETKKAEIKENAVEKTKEKPITRKVIVLSLFSLLLVFILFLFVKYRH